MNSDYELVIIGGGCAGLSLALRLSYLNERCPKILILESKSQYLNDRTWCFWGTHQAKLKNLAQHTWTEAEVSFNQASTVIDCPGTPYCYVPAEAFFEHALAEIAKNSNIEILFNQHITSPINKLSNHWLIKSDQGATQAKVIVDTRPTKSVSGEKSILWQSFYGAEIVCNDTVFDPNRLGLMHFVESHDNAVNFNYILPLTSTTALIEFTVFSAQAFKKEHLETQLNEAIFRYAQGKTYHTVRTESGILPMGLSRQQQGNDETYIRFGLFNGAARPSTGYAFQRIQTWAEGIAKNFEKTGKFDYRFRDPSFQTWMDELFLSVIANNPKVAPTFFILMFKTCNTKSLIRFLSEQGKWHDYMRVIFSLPPWPFIKQLGFNIFRKK